MALVSVCACAVEGAAVEDGAGLASPAPLDLGLRATSVTLLTGDRVHLEPGVDGRSVVHILPGPGRDGIEFVQQWFERHGREEVHVIPGDAVPLLASGQVDPALFDVTALARRPRGEGVRIIVRYRRQRSAAVTAAMFGGQPLTSIRGAVIVESDAAAGAMWSSLTATGFAPSLASDVEKVWLDRVLTPALDRSAPQVGAPESWAAGFEAHGATVAVLDSGVDRWHPDLEEKIREVQDFTGTDPWGLDDIGHGTHVAGTIAGTGFASDGRYRGIAPGADLVIGRVCVSGECLESDILAGMEWAAARARVVNVSLGGDPSDGTTPLDIAINELSATHGTLFVVAAGNEGRDETVGSPGSADAALTVGSVTKDDVLSEFSSRGPRIGDAALKPDMVAPGSGIVAARVPGTDGGEHDPVDDYYARLSGTSMATPHVAGAAAIVAAAHPDWDGARIKAVLMSAARPVAVAAVHAQGAGRLEVPAAVTRSVYASPPSLGFGVVPWPHEQAIERTVTLHNDSDHDVTFALELDVRGPRGEPSPEGTLTIDTGDVLVPAGGARGVTVTLQPGTRPAGVHGGWIRATSSDLVMSIPVLLRQDPETFTLTLRHLDRDGAPARWAAVFLYERDSGLQYPIPPFDEDGRAVLRLPRHRYAMIALIRSGSDAAGHFAMLVDSELDLDRDAQVVLDARTAVPVRATVERADAALTSGYMAAGFQEADHAWLVYLTGRHIEMAATPATAAESQVLEFVSAFGLEGIDARSGRPYRYNLAFASPSGVPATLTYEVRDRDLARVDTTHRGSGTPATAEVHHVAHLPDTMAPGLLGPAVAIPSREIVFFTPGDWSTTVWGLDSDGFLIDWASGERDYARGHLVEEWHRPPFGPALRGSPRVLVSTHDANVITLRLPLFSPSEPGHIAYGLGGEQSATLTRDGVVVGVDSGPAPFFFVPPERAAYTLDVTARHRAVWSAFETAVDVTWTFASEAPASGEPSPLPLLAVRAAGHVDLDGGAPAGGPYLLALGVERAVGAPESPITALALEVSYDDGASWRPAPVLRLGSRGLALLRHPDAAGFVSLRTRAADLAGSSVRQTVIRAYRTE